MYISLYDSKVAYGNPQRWHTAIVRGGIRQSSEVAYGNPQGWHTAIVRGGIRQSSEVDILCR
ncbi:MAG: hypothetical protein IJP82_10155 [Bacteroidaceae bacterium]|nr:hypothetical protein [Bacteroidaceae bacterium]